MKKSFILMTLVAIAAMTLVFSCTKEHDDIYPADSHKVAVSLIAFGESASKVNLDFERVHNIQWSDEDKIAVFDGSSKNQFGIEDGTNTGTSATFTGTAASGAALYVVYPFAAGNTLSGSNLSVTVPANQVIGTNAIVDTTALVSVGKVVAGEAEFKQVCGLVKVEVTTGGIRRIILSGTNLSGTATVSAEGVISAVTDGSNSVELTYEGGANFPKGTYYAAVLPGTTAAGSFSVQIVGGGGLSWQKSASSAVTIVRKTVIGAGTIDSEATFVRHITNKDELYEWGGVMGDESGVIVYLDADIDCESDPWVGMGVTFDGTFEGQDHKIYNLVVNYDGDTGFISRLTGTVRNVTFGSANGSSWDNVSIITHEGTSADNADTHYLGLIGRMAGNGTLDNVVNYASIVAAATNSRVYLGGLVGLVPGYETVTLTSCRNYGSVTNNSTWAGGQTRMGGIVGQCSGAIDASDLENHGALTIHNNVTNFIGGLCGDLGGGSSVTSASNYGTITFTDSGTQKTYIGGCFGSVRGSTILDCHNYAHITLTRNAPHWFGGIAGFMEAGESALMACINHEEAILDVASSVNTNDANASRVLMGGILGGCQYNGEGPFAVTVDDCQNKAVITSHGTASDIGGIAGLLDNYLGSATIAISTCENLGAISSAVVDGATGMGRELRMGGIVGGTDAEDGKGCDQVIQSCINRGSVTAAGALKAGASVRFGGIVGNTYNNVVIDDCKNYGHVGCDNAGTDGGGSAVFYFGGIVGSFLGRTAAKHQSVTNCINTGEISTVRAYNNQYLGGIVGGGSNADTYPVVSGCKNFGVISATKLTNTLVGGLCGYTRWNMSDCSNFGNVVGGAHNGAVVGDANGNAIMTVGIKVGEDVEVTGAANAGTKYTEGKKTYTFTTSSTLEKRWFTGDGTGAAVTVTVVDQETYSE